MKSPRTPLTLPPLKSQPLGTEGEQVQPAALPPPILVQPKLSLSLFTALPPPYLLEDSPQQRRWRRDVFQYFKRLGLIFVAQVCFESAAVGIKTESDGDPTSCLHGLGCAESRWDAHTLA